jgi:polysaccharide biosynthesis/export protein VpsN
MKEMGFEQGQRWVLGVGLAFVLMMGTGIASVSPQSYRLGPNDVVKVQVYGEEDLTVESQIDGDGNITFPLLGVVHVQGKTIQEFQQYLTARLADGYVRAPKVTTFVVKFRNFYVNGEVKAPGGYSYQEGLTVHKAITMAGGFTDKAAKGRTKVLRTVNGKEISVPIDLDSLVSPEDIIVVPRSFF